MAIRDWHTAKEILAHKISAELLEDYKLRLICINEILHKLYETNLVSDLFPCVHHAELDLSINHGEYFEALPPYILVATNKDYMYKIYCAKNAEVWIPENRIDIGVFAKEVAVEAVLKSITEYLRS